MSGPVRRIGATYRLQIRDLGFAGTAALVPYLAALGIETLYLSPVFTARTGSSHGYDVVDPNEIDPALGGVAGFEALLDAASTSGLNVLVDVVPNHLAIDPKNAAFEAALREGPSSSAGAMFDVDWDDAGGRIVLCVLDRPLADELAAETVTIGADGDAIETPGRSYPLAHPLLGNHTHPISEIVAEVLAAQHYRLAYWRLRTSELNYRRFFEIDDLIALRQEDSAVYRSTHALVLSLAADRRIGGLRVDHIDGLTDPAGYLRRLTDDLDRTSERRPTVVVEKILAARERLARWPVEGTTGYDFARLAFGVFVDRDGAATLAEEYRVRTGDLRSFPKRQQDSKRAALDELFPAQLERTSRLFAETIASIHPGSDVARDDLTEAVRALICALPVYRTYGVGSVPMERHDVDVVLGAMQEVAASCDPEVVRAAGLLTDIVAGGVEPPSPTFSDARRRFQQLASAVMAKGSEDTALFDPGTALVGADVGADPEAPAVEIEAFHEAMADRRRRPAGLNATSTHDTKRSEDVRARLAVLSELSSQWLITVDRWRRANEHDRGGCDVADEIYLYETIVGLATPGRTTAPELRRRVGDHLEKAAREAKRRTTWSDPDLGYEHDLRHLTETVLAAKNASFHRDLERMLARMIDPAAANALGLTVVKVAAPGVPDVYQGTEAGIASLTDPDNRRPVPFDALRRALRRQLSAATDAEPPAAGFGSVPDPRKFVVTARALGARRDDPELFDAGRYVPLFASGDQADHVLAFARARGRRSAIALVTRLSAGLTYSRGRVATRAWGDTRLEIPPTLAGSYRDALSGAAFTLEGPVPVASILPVLPVALLVRSS